MPRFLPGARWWSVRRSHVLPPPVSPSLERSPGLDGSGMLSNMWQVKRSCTSGADLAVEVAQDTAPNIYNLCVTGVHPSKNLDDTSKHNGEAPPRDKYVLSSWELPFRHRQEVSAAFEQVEAANSSKETADQSLLLAGKPHLVEDTFESLKEVLSGHFNNSLKGGSGEQGQRVPKPFKLDIPRNLLGGNAGKGSPAKKSWAQLMGQNVKATNASHFSTGSAGHYSVSSKDGGDDFSDLDYPQEAEDVQTKPSLSLAAQPSRNPATKAPESLAYGSILESLMKDSVIASNSTKDAPRKPKPYSKRFALSNAQSINAYNKPIDVNIFSSAGITGVTSASSGDSSFMSRVVTPIKSLKDSSIMESGYRVCIDNVPSEIDLACIKESISMYGEVTGSFKKSRGKGLSACYIEFKTDEAKENALAFRWVYIDGQRYRINRAEQPLTTVVRISNVSKDTPESKVLFTCERCGGVDKVTRRDTGVFDVYFKVMELANIPQILDSLNEVTLNQIRWKAQPAPLIHPETKGTFFQTEEGLKWFLLQVDRVLKKLGSTINRARISIEDLRELVYLYIMNQVPGFFNSNSESASPLISENLGLLMKGLSKS